GGSCRMRGGTGAVTAAPMEPSIFLHTLVVPAKAGTQAGLASQMDHPAWIPAFAGMARELWDPCNGETGLVLQRCLGRDPLALRHRGRVEQVTVDEMAGLGF